MARSGRGAVRADLVAKVASVAGWRWGTGAVQQALARADSIIRSITLLRHLIHYTVAARQYLATNTASDERARVCAAEPRRTVSAYAICAGA